MEQLIEFKKLQTPATTLDKLVVAELSSFNVKGDWLNGVPSLEQAEYFITSTLTKFQTNSKKYWEHSPLVLRKDKEGVWIARVKYNKEVKMWGFVHKK